LEGLVAEYGSDALSAPQGEKLAELRHGAVAAKGRSRTHKLLKLLYAASEIGSFGLRSRHAGSLG